ncbi:MAG: hydantoinase/oxoprolinase family protein, partial [Pseudomonadota bacterium]
VDENMGEAARAHASEWGKDFSDRALIATGGAAPLHAARLGEKLGIKTVIIPKDAGVGSAIGFLLAPISFEVVRSRFMSLGAFDATLARTIFDDLESEADTVVSAAAPKASKRALRQAHMRYRGQGYEIAVDMPASFVGADGVSSIRAAFEDAYRQLYGRVIPDIDIEILTWTLRLTADTPSITLGADHDLYTEGLQSSTQRVFDAHRGARMDTAVWERSALDVSTVIEGPALILEDQTTSVVSSIYRAKIGAGGHIIMESREPYNA